MTPTFIPVAIGSATLIVAAAQLAKGRTPRLRVFIGGTVAAFVLTVAAGFVPGIARGIAVLAILGALLTSGYDLAKPLASLVS